MTAVDILPYNYLTLLVAKSVVMESRSENANSKIDPVPKKVISEFCPPARNGEAQFGTLSFRVRGSSDDFAPEYDYSSLIAEIVRRRHPALLLCSGYSVIDETSSLVIADASKNGSSVVIVETKAPPSGKTKPECYRISGGELVPMGPQYFARRDDKAKGLVELERRIKQRRFFLPRDNVLRNRQALLLICGELGVLSGRKFVKIDPLVMPATRSAIEDAAIVLNPTHTRMGNAGTLKAKRKFLSENGKTYLSASNWLQSDDGRGQKITDTLHSAWHDGSNLTPSFTSENAFFCYREWNIPA